MSNKDKVLELLADAWVMPKVRDDQLTVEDFRHALRKSDLEKSTIRKRIKSLVEAGILAENWARSAEGYRCKAYSPGKDRTWEDVIDLLADKNKLNGL